MLDLDEQRLEPEHVAYWYFRLNGFFQMESFIVHPPGKGSQRTDADLLGIRFPYRQEMFFDELGRTMEDDTEVLQLSGDAIDVVIIEVKTNQPCSLNGPWSDQEQQNVHRVLAAIGCIPMEEIDAAAANLYDTGECWPDDQNIRVRLITLGGEVNPKLAEDYPRVVQVTWDRVLAFIGTRLHEFRTNKRDVSQWDDQIKFLQDLTADCSRKGVLDLDAFVRAASNHMGVRLD